MRILLSVLFLAVFAIGGNTQTKSDFVGADKDVQTASNEVGSRTPVLVELFTAEGCPNCPMAEEFLSVLLHTQPIKGVEIIPIALHVDYWDKYGIRDKYATRHNSLRQLLYEEVFETGRIYTPQIVIDGKKELIGTRRAEVFTAIETALKTAKAKIQIEFDGQKLDINVSSLPVHKDSTLFVAITEDGIKHRLKRSNQPDPTFEQVAVSRSLRAVAKIAEDKNEIKKQLYIQDVELKKDRKLNAVVFVQENASRKILGAKKIKLIVPQKNETEPTSGDHNR